MQRPASPPRVVLQDDGDRGTARGGGRLTLRGCPRVQGSPVGRTLDVQVPPLERNPRAPAPRCSSSLEPTPRPLRVPGGVSGIGTEAWRAGHTASRDRPPCPAPAAVHGRSLAADPARRTSQRQAQGWVSPRGTHALGLRSRTSPCGAGWDSRALALPGAHVAWICSSDGPVTSGWRQRFPLSHLVIMLPAGCQ